MSDEKPVILNTISTHYSPVLVIFMLEIFHDARNFPTFSNFLRRKITSILSNVLTVTRVLYWQVVEQGDIIIKETFNYDVIYKLCQ